MLHLLLIVVLVFCLLSGSLSGRVKLLEPLANSPPIASYMATSTLNPRSLPAVKVSANGDAVKILVVKQRLANELKLPLRDLRIVDPNFPSSIHATFAARPNAILFTLDNIKVIVKHNEALIFSPFEDSVIEDFVPVLQQQICNSFSEASNSPPRFEHLVIEASLNLACNMLVQKVRALTPAVTAALDGLRAESRGLDFIHTQVDELLPLKNALDELRKRVKELDCAVTEVLDSDEDMIMMHLGQTPCLGIPTNLHNSGSTVYKDSELGAMKQARVNTPTAATPTISVGEQHHTRHRFGPWRQLSNWPRHKPYTLSHSRGHISVSSSFAQSLRMKYGFNKEYSGSSTSNITMSNFSYGNKESNGNNIVKNNGSSSHIGGINDELFDAKGANFSAATEPIKSILAPTLKTPGAIDTLPLETMLENYLNEIGWIASEIDEVVDTIANTEENVVLQMDLLRNRMLRFELLLSISSFVVSCGALVTGLFGMNLLSHMEHSPSMFYVVTLLLGTGMLTTFLAFTKHGKSEKLF